MSMEGNTNQYHGDASMPSFRFSQAEREAKVKEFMTRRGMTKAEAEVEVVLQEAIATDRLAKEQLRKEQKSS